MIELNPSPIEIFSPGSLWIKRDDLIHPLYGGNKPRKLQRILQQARHKNASCLLTIGAVGSHHVLATAIFGKKAGFSVRALLTPQPRTPHVIEVVRASIGQGVLPVPFRTSRDLPRVLLSLPGTFFIPLGGSGLEGTLAFVDAAQELRAAVERNELPVPDEIVVAAGSGGTAAGLAVGLAREGLPTRVVAVAVFKPTRFVQASVLSLATRAAWHLDLSPVQAIQKITFVHSAIGAGYGYPTQAGQEATEIAVNNGIILDPTYTAKAFSVALSRSQSRRVLYWHTLSSTPMEPLLADAPSEGQLPPNVRDLFSVS